MEDDALWPWLRDRILLAIAAENAEGMRYVLDLTVDYAKSRVAFGRPIGTYQAIKHALADMLGLAECSTAAMLYAAWSVSEDNGGARLGGAKAKGYPSEAHGSVPPPHTDTLR